MAGLTREGYTLQTVLGLWSGLNHMNGRVEDAWAGRMLSADPTIPDPTNTQSYNRFSYVDNNPATLIDPTGFDPNGGDPQPNNPCGDDSDPSACGSVLPPLPPPPKQPGVFTCLLAGGGWSCGFHPDPPPLTVIPPLNSGLPSPGGANDVGGGGYATPGTPAKPAKPSTPAGTPHTYVISRSTLCSAPAAFSQLMQQGMSAPGAPAGRPGTRTIQLPGLTSPNPISQFVDPSTMTITNTTLQGHVFDPGSVFIQVTPNPDGTSNITITGTGTGNYPEINDLIGEVIFGTIAGSVANVCDPPAGP